MNKDDYCLYPGCSVVIGEEDKDSYWCSKHNEENIEFQVGVFLDKDTTKE